MHRALGPGLLESVYRVCLKAELAGRGLHVQSEVPLPVRFRGVLLDCGYRLDLVVESELIVELKSVRTLDELHMAQLLTYLRLSQLTLGLLNFNVPVLRQGIRRLILTTSS